MSGLCGSWGVIVAGGGVARLYLSTLLGFGGKTRCGGGGEVTKNSSVVP